MKITYTKTAEKAINSMNKATKQRIKQGIEGLTCIPPQGDIKYLQGSNEKRQRLRVGKYRIIFKYSNITENQQTITILCILDIGSRGDIYK